MKEEKIFIKEYNKANRLNIKGDLDIHDECSVSYLDVLKEKEIEVESKVCVDCKCVSSTNFGAYYDKCDKCDGRGKYILNNNEVMCNKCRGTGRVVREVCPLCDGTGKVISKGKVVVKLSKNVLKNDVVVVEGKGKVSNGLKGKLFLKIIVKDKECFEIVNNDVYDKRILQFNKEEINKGICKNVETVQGFVKVKSNAEEEREVVKLEKQGIDGGDYYICLENELTPIKGEDVYKNVIVDKTRLGFYISKSELCGNKKSLGVHYYKKLNDLDLEYIELESANNFKIVKLKRKGLEGKNGGDRGDLYLRIYFDDEFYVADDKLYYKPVKLTKYEINEGKKFLEFAKDKLVLNFPRGLKEEKEVSVRAYGFMTCKNVFEELNFIVSPFDYEVYRVSVRVNKKDKIIYLKDYRKYFNEEVCYSDRAGLKIVLNKKGQSIACDDEGNKVIVSVLR